MKKAAKRWLLGSALAALLVAVLLARPVFHLARTWWRDRPEVVILPAGVVDDASRMNRTGVALVWDIPADPAAAEEQLRSLIRKAKAEGRRIAIAGARHSMGGHTIAVGGIVLNMLPFYRMSLDLAARILTVGAGARWSEVIPYVDARGCSVAIMQSNDSFSVGGSISVNLIDAALELEGAYYLPYRLHATPAQFRKAYPEAVRCFERKRYHDPDGLFQNGFSEQYGSLKRAFTVH